MPNKIYCGSFNPLISALDTLQDYHTKMDLIYECMRLSGCKVKHMDEEVLISLADRETLECYYNQLFSAD